jgi:RimJ/RimL family protein N-acetyltransferase
VPAPYAGWPASPSTLLRGERVVLEPLAREHTGPLLEAAGDPRIWAYMPLDPTASRAHFDRFVADALERAAAGLEAPYCVRVRETGRVVGSTRYLALRPEHRGLEIGWTWLSPAAWGTGVNVEAKLLLLTHAFETLRCMRVEFKTDARNERSRAALAALPARFEGIFRKHMLVGDGVVRDSAWYAITDEEWPAVKETLAERARGG